jgi:hypothetical protein
MWVRYLSKWEIEEFPAPVRFFLINGDLLGINKK